jgi:two-component system sensor histidine kinase/response regulator
MLDRLGLAYDFADNGAHALRRLASADYSVVLMDMEMPEMDGVTATKEYRREEAEQGRTRLPIIAMTANALQEDRERCFAAGMDGYISKPISLSALQDELRRIFGGAAVSQPAMTGTEAGAGAGGVFDRRRAIEMMGDEELFQQLAGMYVTDAPGYLHEIDDALAAADSARLARAAHTLKGLFATFAAAPGEAVARQLEQAAHQGATDACTELVQQVRAQAEALAAALAAG